MPSLSGLVKRQQGILRNQSIRGFFGFESSLQNCFWYVFSTSGLSQNCKIRNAWKTIFLQNKIFKLFSEHEIRVFLEKRLGSFQTFLFLQIRDKPDVLKKIQKQF
jgi:hypothetical protein